MPSSNFALGIRRVRIGYEQWQFMQRTFDPGIVPILAAGGGDDEALPVRNNINFIYTRALGLGSSSDDGLQFQL